MSNPFPPKDNRISLQKAIEMTKRYRDNKAQILAPGIAPDTLPLCETFTSASVTRLLSNPKAVSFRIYYGMDENLKINAVLIGADDDGADILPATTLSEDPDPTDDDPLDDSYRCPPVCPPSSDLNTP